ncbi:hypothetical protein [Brevundimonas sp.]|uniref:hypothetical protein n=1 Tax=Brevundimonas sp. TaxID=1871086 RepID=UPI0035ADB6A0
MRLTSLPPILALAVALPAVAQDAARDWDLHRNTRTDAIMAYTVYDNGLGIAVRCVDGGYEAFLSGLPAAGAGETRTLDVAFADEELGPQSWNVGVNDTIAVSSFPAPFARKLRQGGRLQIRVPDGAGPGRALRYDVTLPASPGSIDETLTACERPLVDPRDAGLDALPDNGLPENLVWARRPVVDYPSRTRYARGFAVTTCLVDPDGALRDCTIETEHPRDGGFGEETLQAVRRARVRDTGGLTDLPPVMVSFRVNFVIQGYETREDRERMRENRRKRREEREAEG